MNGISFLIGLSVAVLGWQPFSARADVQVAHASSARKTADYKKSHLGIAFSPVDYQDTFGLRVDAVYPGSSADEAGVEIGDLMIGIDGEPLSSLPREQAATYIRERVQAIVPGQTVALQLVRGQEILQLRAVLRTLTVGAGPKMPRTDRAIHPEWKTTAPSAEELAVERLTAHYEVAADYRDLRSRLRDLTASADPFRIEEVAFVQRNPFRMREVAEGILERIRPGRDHVTTASNFLREAARLLHGPPSVAGVSARLPPLRTGISVAAHVAQLKVLLAEADAAWAGAFKLLTPDEIDFLYQSADGFAKHFEDSNYIYADPDRERRLRNVRVISLAAKVNHAALIASAASLMRMGNRRFLAGFRRDLESAGLDLAKAEVLSEKTPYGEILIGGTGDNRYANLDERGVAVLIDLGGNDFYANRIAAATRKIRAAVVIDVAGDDAYESNVDYSQGSGYMGIGILIDTGGNDSYIGGRMSQGASLLGVGLLLDGNGNDLYRAHTYAQGSAYWGVAALIDQAGNDRYEARLLSQAVGIAGGIGALIDRSGNDSYYAKGAVPSRYASPGTFDGWSQGVGVGIRGYASGGVGILYEGGGNNRMEAGDFCQGGGYYFGWGILRGGRGNDTYIGSRYAQGFAAHFALGTLLEEGGDDRYETREAVAAGLAWDLSIAWFEDRGGNDRYPARTFSLGASAHNAITVFIDHGGNDRLVGAFPHANGQVNDYHGGTSLSLVLNLGRKSDRLDFRGRHTFLLNSRRNLKQTLDRVLRNQGISDYPPVDNFGKF